MRLVDFDVEFKKDMSNIEIAGVESIIGKLLDDWDVELYGATKESLDLIYSSTGKYALLGADDLFFLYNVDEYSESLAVSHFAITTSNLLIMVCEDNDENEVMIEIEPSEF